MPVRRADQRLILTHPNGSSAEVLLYGATVISWKTGTKIDAVPVERLFVSSKAALDGSKAVRGGIPIVFPCFGAPSHEEHALLGQHGFARNQVWMFEGVVRDDGSGVSVRLTLDPTASIQTVYGRPFHLGYVVTLGEHELGTELHVTNTCTSGGDARDNKLEFQALMHNYILAPASEVLVFPLQNKRYYDKTEGSEQGRKTAKTETRTGVDVREYTDSVYEDAGGKYEVRWPGGGMEIQVTGMKDVVVWNPQREVGSKIGDMEDGGWTKYVCVEPGHVQGYAEVGAGETWVGGQVLSTLGS